ncbi:hypothetical protein M427DRAFT_165767 [Gonapodya prolifera JEL478]|uniref:Uncharacterized protein n=1 Tax=Gonapodya prolifera (strain JEL478) TaxID=1344416 RepID=A0A139AZJ3_GONPJ|nr:hypothetical protein M427DRAFT_165767 [Gonapodya prolifera JEL478]|eukprot:KXS22139.1 hypothetical protein M427DRAFT_165767 [Gonapodya prolifera JEL478]
MGLLQEGEGTTTEMDFETYELFDGLTRETPEIVNAMNSVENIASAIDKTLSSIEEGYLLRREALNELTLQIGDIFDAQKSTMGLVDSLENQNLKLGYEASVLEDKVKELQEVMQNFISRLRALVL